MPFGRILAIFWSLKDKSSNGFLGYLGTNVTIFLLRLHQVAFSSKYNFSRFFSKTLFLGILDTLHDFFGQKSTSTDQLSSFWVGD
jgi:hypothetical protein